MEGNDTEETHWIYEECEIKKEDFNVIAQAVTIENQNFQKEVLAEILLNQIKGGGGVNEIKDLPDRKDIF